MITSAISIEIVQELATKITRKFDAQQLTIRSPSSAKGRSVIPRSASAFSVIALGHASRTGSVTRGSSRSERSFSRSCYLRCWRAVIKCRGHLGSLRCQGHAGTKAYCEREKGTERGELPLSLARMWRRMRVRERGGRAEEREGTGKRGTG